MERINTANKAIDLFGAGKHGFKAGVPATGDRATYMSPDWCNGIQEVLAQYFESRGIALDLNVHTQLIDAITEHIANEAFDISGLVAHLGAAGDVDQLALLVGGTHKRISITDLFLGRSGLDQVARDQIALTNMRQLLSSSVSSGALVAGHQWELATDEWATGSTGYTLVAGSPGYYVNGGGTKVVFLTATGAGTWVVPSDWSGSGSVECYGGGGGGSATLDTQVPGGGGGGGAYAKRTGLALAVGANVNFSVGVGGAGAASGQAGNGGDTWFNAAAMPGTGDATAIGAKGGAGANGQTGGAGGAAAASCGELKYSGGAGGASTQTNAHGAAGGGGAAGPNGPGGAGGQALTNYNSGAGGGGSGGGGSGAGGFAGGNVINDATPAAGGNNSAGVGGGAGNTAGTNGGGGGGGLWESAGKAGGAGTDYTATAGATAGAGGGGGGGAGSTGGAGGLYGGGGGGGNGYPAAGSEPGGAGGQGLIVITYAPVTDMILVSPSVTVSSAPDYVDAYLLYKDDSGTAVLGTDLTVELSRDGGTTWTLADLSIIAVFDASYATLRARASVAAQPAGTSLKARITTINSKAQRIGAPAIYAE